jgi:plasmid stabilization system protein ParE
MTPVVVTRAAAEDLGRLIVTHSLPADTPERLRRSLRSLDRFPQAGGRLADPWADLRFVLGPWRWMVIVYFYDEAADEVTVITVQDGRSTRAARPA